MQLLLLLLKSGTPSPIVRYGIHLGGGKRNRIDRHVCGTTSRAKKPWRNTQIYIYIHTYTTRQCLFLLFPKMPFTFHYLPKCPSLFIISSNTLLSQLSVHTLLLPSIHFIYLSIYIHTYIYHSPIGPAPLHLCFFYFPKYPSLFIISTNTLLSQLLVHTQTRPSIHLPIHLSYLQVTPNRPPPPLANPKPDKITPGINKNAWNSTTS